MEITVRIFWLTVLRIHTVGIVLRSDRWILVILMALSVILMIL